MIFKLLTFIFTFVTFLNANTIDISSIDAPTNILNQTKVYVDKSNKLDFEYILENSDKLFDKNKKDYLHLGYSTDAIWLKFSITNHTSTKVTKVLEVDNQILDHITLFTKEKEGYKKELKGVLNRKVFNENIINFYFDISLKPMQSKEYYLKVSSSSSALFFRLNIMSKNELYQKEIKHQLVLTLFFASIITLIIYNLFIFFFTKDFTYLYYVLYLSFTVLAHLSYTALSFYIYPVSFWEIDIYLAIFYLSFIIIFTVLFVRKFLDTKKYKKIDYIFKLFLIMNLIFIVFTSPEFYPINIIVLIQLSVLVYIIGVSFYLLYKGEDNAKYMLVGWTVVVFGWIMIATYNYGYWSLLESYPYFYELSVFVEAILFSIALANKLNKTKELEKSVMTNKLLTNELHHRVKNNMQFIISMYRLKLAKFSNQDISDSLKEVEGTIQAMSATHEMLYSQKLTEDIETKEYINTLVDRLKKSYDISNIKIQLDISTSLNIDYSIYVGIILNEIITNSFKYAFKDNKGEIFISLSKHNSSYKLIVNDDGIGFDTKKESDTFGIELIKTLVKDELNGKINIDASNGCTYDIEWK